MGSTRTVVLLFVVGVCLIGALPARGQSCIGTGSYTITCDNSAAHCHSWQVIYYCTSGCMGSSCITGYGLCCGNQYSSSSATGYCNYCTSPVRAAGSEDTRPTISRQLSKEISDIPLRLIFVPDHCAKTYGVFDPAALINAHRTPRHDNGISRRDVFTTNEAISERQGG